MAEHSRARAKLIIVAAVTAAMFFGARVLAHGLTGAAPSPAKLAALVLTLSIGLPLTAICAYVVVTSLRQLRRLETVRLRRPGATVVAASAMFLASMISHALDLNRAERVRRLGSFFIVAADSDGVEFWAGAPRDPIMRRRLAWSQIESVTAGTVVQSRATPGVALHLKGAEYPITFAPCRPGALVMWVELDERTVDATIHAIAAARPAGT